MNLRFAIAVLIMVASVAVVCETNLPAVQGSGAIYIHADGTISPSGVNLTTSDLTTYTFTGDVNDTIVIQRSNIVLEGEGYTLTAAHSISDQAIYVYQQSNVTIRNLRIESSWIGITLYYGTLCNITSNTITGNSWYGISLYSSSSNTILGNNITYNRNRGIYLEYSSYNTIQDNEVAGNYRGIELDKTSNNNAVYRNHISNSTDNNIILNQYSDHNTVSENNITQSVSSGIVGMTNINNTITHNIVRNHSDNGIKLAGCQNCTVMDNEVTGVSFGIVLQNSNCSVLKQNAMSNNTSNFVLYFYRQSDFDNDVDDSNTVDGKPIYYWVEKEDMSIPSDAGLIILYKCTNITVEKLGFTATNYHTIVIGYSAGARISECSIINSTYAIWLWNASNCLIDSNYLQGFMGVQLEYSTNNIIYNNTLTHGGNWGAVGITLSSGNTFYQNNFTANYYDAYWSDSSTNYWNSSYTNGGNYWDRYVDRMINPTDAYSGPNQDLLGADGFWDVPYPVSADSLDHYPIVPEYTSGIIVLPLGLVTLVAAIAFRRKKD